MNRPFCWLLIYAGAWGEEDGKKSLEEQQHGEQQVNQTYQPEMFPWFQKIDK